MGRRGATIISVIIAAAIVVIASAYFLSAIPKSRKKTQELHQRLVAQAFATELLETFRAFKDDHFLEYLRFNPVDFSKCGAFCQSNTGSCVNEPGKTQGCNKVLFKFCSHINILDRNTGTVVNNDPMADLPPSLLDIPKTDPAEQKKWRANRYYQVQIVNTKPTTPGSLEIRKDLCSRTPYDVALNAGTGGHLSTCPGHACPVTLTKDEKFLITVGVSWIPPGRDVTLPERVVLTTIAPDNHS